MKQRTRACAGLALRRRASGTLLEYVGYAGYVVYLMYDSHASADVQFLPVLSSAGNGFFQRKQELLAFQSSRIA